MDRAPIADGTVIQVGRTLIVTKLLSDGTLTLLRGADR